MCLGGPGKHCCVGKGVLFRSCGIICCIGSSVPLTSSETEHPVAFLSCAVRVPRLGPGSCFIHPHPRGVRDLKRLSLAFLIGGTTLSRGSRRAERSLGGLGRSLLAVIESRASELARFRVINITSPSNGCGGGLSLTNEEAHFTLDRVASTIPRCTHGEVCVASGSIITP